MRKNVKIAFLALGIAIASIGTVKQTQAKKLAGECKGDGTCGTTTQGTILFGKWHESEVE